VELYSKYYVYSIQTKIHRSFCKMMIELELKAGFKKTAKFKDLK
jgi:hypothetical protein